MKFSLKQYVEAADLLARHFRDLHGERFQMASVRGCEMEGPVPPTAIAVVWVWTTHLNEDYKVTMRSYHCFLDDAGHRIPGAQREFEKRVDKWLTDLQEAVEDARCWDKIEPPAQS